MLQKQFTYNIFFIGIFFHPHCQYIFTNFKRNSNSTLSKRSKRTSQNIQNLQISYTINKSIKTHSILFKPPKQMSSPNPYFYSQDVNAIYDIYTLFKYYNQFFFDGILEKCTIEWSTKMTLCAGTCENKGFGSCCIKLSEPLLKYRTPNQLKETILHEMIHAYLFITNPQACLKEGGHGKQFKDIMNNINEITKLRVTIYHNFTDEVDSYRTHIWRCNGICRERPPFYGYVKRSMNRKPQPADSWWKEHQRYCGGEFVKISEPENTKKGNLKNGKKFKTNTSLEKSSFSGKGKTLEDYAKEMEKRPKNQSKPKNQVQVEIDAISWSYQQNYLTQNKISQKVQQQKREKKQERKEGAKSKPKKEKEERESHKITQWFSKKQGKTIEQYSKQIQEQKMMSMMSFRR